MAKEGPPPVGYSRVELVHHGIVIGDFVRLHLMDGESTEAFRARQLDFYLASVEQWLEFVATNDLPPSQATALAYKALASSRELWSADDPLAMGRRFFVGDVRPMLDGLRERILAELGSDQVPAAEHVRMIAAANEATRRIAGAFEELAKRFKAQFPGCDTPDDPPAAAEGMQDQKPPSKAAGATPATKGKRKGKRIDERMLAAIRDNLEAKCWSGKQWADNLACSPSTVKATKTWKLICLPARETARLAKGHRLRQKNPR